MCANYWRSVPRAYRIYNVRKFNERQLDSSLDWKCREKYGWGHEQISRTEELITQTRRRQRRFRRTTDAYGGLATYKNLPTFF